MSQEVYFGEVTYRLIEQLLFATENLAAKIEVLTQQLITQAKAAEALPEGEITRLCDRCKRVNNCDKYRDGFSGCANWEPT